MAIVVISKSDGKIEFERAAFLPPADVFGSITEKAVYGSPHYDPNTGTNSRIAGQLEFEDISVEWLLDKTTFPLFVDWKNNFWRPKSQGITATLSKGGIITHLTGVKYGGMQYGEVDKLSNDASKIRVTIMPGGTRLG